MRDSLDEETASLPPTDEQKVRKPSTHRPLTPTVSEEVEELIEQSIEIESNKKMRKDHLSWFSLTFRSPDTETKVSIQIPMEEFKKLVVIESLLVDIPGVID
ncbi:adenylate cyclase type 8 [Trichonephila clavipes]|nr:adenylate cyclase type 8 [Trichonephila clavipes]